MALQPNYSETASEMPASESGSFRQERVCYVCELNFKTANAQKHCW